MYRVALLSVLSAGCATALSTTQPVETLRPGEFHVGVSTDISIPASRIIDAVDAAKEVGEKYAADPDYVPTDAEQRRYFDAAAGLAVAGVGPLTDFHVRYGVFPRIDVGLRYTGVGVHLEAKGQLLGEPGDGGWQASLTAGYVHGLFKGLVFDALELLKVDDFSRKDLQLGVLVGRRLGSYGHFWAGPRYAIAAVGLDSQLRNVDETLTIDETIHYLGGVAGLALGYGKVFAFAELTVMNMWASPTVLGAETDIGGIVVMPSVGVLARF